MDQKESDKRKEVITARCSLKEKEKIAFDAIKNDMKESEYIRDCCLKQNQRNTIKYKKALIMMVKCASISANFNRVLKDMESLHETTGALEYLGLLNEISDELDDCIRGMED